MKVYYKDLIELIYNKKEVELLRTIENKYDTINNIESYRQKIRAYVIFYNSVTKEVLTRHHYSQFLFTEDSPSECLFSLLVDSKFISLEKLSNSIYTNYNITSVNAKVDILTDNINRTTRIFHLVDIGKDNTYNNIPDTKFKPIDKVLDNLQIVINNCAFNINNYLEYKQLSVIKKEIRKINIFTKIKNKIFK